MILGPYNTVQLEVQTDSGYVGCVWQVRFEIASC